MSSRRLQRTIENPTLELKIISASDVPYIDATDRMDVYAVVSIKDDYTQKKQAAKTPIDYDGGSNPTWNHIIKFSVNEKAAIEGLLTIYVKLFSYWLEGENDLYLGEVNVSVQELVASNPLPPFPNGNVNKMKLVTYPVKVIGETKPNAKLSLSYRFKPVMDLYPPAPDYLSSLSQPVYPNPDPPASGQAVIYPPQLQTTTVTKLALELVIKFAKDIKKVNILDEMHVYASVTIREGKKTVKHMSNTPIAFSAYQNPKWDHAVKFSLDEPLARDGRSTLFVRLMSHRPFFGDKQIGEVDISIQELLSLNPPLTSGDSNDMMLVTEDVSGSYGKKGTLSFTYRFLKEQVTFPKPSPSTTPQPFIMYLPVPHQAYSSPDSIHGASGYVNVHPGAHVGSSNGLVPIYMAPPYQSHGYQHYSPHQPQPHAQQQQSQLLPQESLSRPLHDIQSHSYQSYGYQHYSPPEPLQQQQTQLLSQQPTESQGQTQGARPQVKPQGGTIAAIGLGASVLGRVIGGALISDMMSDEVNNPNEVEA